MELPPPRKPLAGRPACTLHVDNNKEKGDFNGDERRSGIWSLSDVFLAGVKKTVGKELKGLQGRGEGGGGGGADT